MPTGPISGTKFIFSVHVFQVPKSSSKRGDNLKNIFLVTKVLLIILFMYGRLNVFFLSHGSHMKELQWYQFLKWWYVVWSSQKFSSWTPWYLWGRDNHNFNIKLQVMMVYARVFLIWFYNKLIFLLSFKPLGVEFNINMEIIWNGNHPIKKMGERKWGFWKFLKGMKTSKYNPFV